MTLRELRAAPQDRPEVEHVVLYVPAIAVLGQEVEAVHAARIVVVEPGPEHPGAPQFTPVLVGHDVVRVVRPRAVIAEVAQRRALGKAACQHAVVAVRLTRRPAENGVHVAPGQVPLGADERVVNLRIGRDHDGVRVERHQEHLDRVIAEGVIERRADDLGPGGHLRVLWWIKLDLICVPGRDRAFGIRPAPPWTCRPTPPTHRAR